MANNYRQFSAMLLVSDETERAWCMLELESRRTFDDSSFWPCADSMDFLADLEPEGIWLHSEENGNVDDVAEFVSAFLAKFHPNQAWSLSWADTCNTQRIDEFSGGAVFVTATEIRHIEARNWIYQQEEAWRKNQS